MNSATLNRIQLRQLSFMPDSVQVLRKAAVSDDAGGANDGTYVVVETTIGRRQAANREAHEALYAERLGAEVAYIASLPYGTDVHLADRLEFNSAQTLEVASILSGSWSTVTRVLCTEVL